MGALPISGLFLGCGGGHALGIVFPTLLYGSLFGHLPAGDRLGLWTCSQRDVTGGAAAILFEGVKVS